MKIVGLTGGIGSGKSTVLNQFKNLGSLHNKVVLDFCGVLEK